MTKTQQKNRDNPVKVKECRGQLLSWYDKHKRSLPWRTPSGQKANPYHVWLSEIMLQQTTVGAVKPYFEKFLSKWPTVKDLANANQDEIMNDWAGLGYYNRARNLHKCAKYITEQYNGQFPSSPKELINLPGIGEYTSAAITTIAFNKPATVVDGNIERVISRLFSILEPLPKSKNKIKKHAKYFFENYTERPGDLAQAFMDLGATICIAKTPRCVLCPISEHCNGYQSGIAETLPRKEKKKPKPQRYGSVYWIKNKSDEILLHRRPDKGLLAGTLALPTSEWIDDQSYKELNILKEIQPLTHKPSFINHSFTHFDLQLELKTARISNMKKGDYFWHPVNDIKTSQFPTVFKKPLKLFLKT